MPILNNLTVNEIVSGQIPGYYLKKTINSNGKLVTDYQAQTLSTGTATDVGDYGLEGWVAFNTFVWAFGNIDCSSLTTVSGQYAFRSAFESANIYGLDFSNLVTISGQYAFNRAFANMTYSLGVPTTMLFPSLTTIGTRVFNRAWVDTCRATEISMPSLTNIGSRAFDNAFYNNSRLTTLTLGGTAAMTIASDAFSDMFAEMFNNVTVNAPAANKSDIEAMSGYPNFGSYGTVTWNWVS